MPRHDMSSGGGRVPAVSQDGGLQSQCLVCVPVSFLLAFFLSFFLSSSEGQKRQRMFLLAHSSKFVGHTRVAGAKVEGSEEGSTDSEHQEATTTIRASGEGAAARGGTVANGWMND